MDPQSGKLRVDGVGFLDVFFTNYSNFGVHSIGGRNFEGSGRICDIFGCCFSVHSTVDNHIFTGVAFLPSKGGRNIFGNWAFNIGDHFVRELQSKGRRFGSSSNCRDSKASDEDVHKLKLSN